MAHRRAVMDLRRHTRIPVDFTFLVETGGGESHLVHAVDLSLGGVRFNSVGFDAEDVDEVMTRFNFGSDAVSIRARTVRGRNLDGFCTEVGLAFQEMEEATKKILRRRLHGC